MRGLLPKHVVIRINDVHERVIQITRMELQQILFQKQVFGLRWRDLQPFGVVGQPRGIVNARQSCDLVQLGHELKLLEVTTHGNVDRRLRLVRHFARGLWPV